MIKSLLLVKKLKGSTFTLAIRHITKLVSSYTSNGKLHIYPWCDILCHSHEVNGAASESGYTIKSHYTMMTDEQEKSSLTLTVCITITLYINYSYYGLLLL